MNQLKHLILTHSDLDGFTAMINVYNIIKNKYNFQYIHTGYNSLEKKLKNLHKEVYDVLWILDLNLHEDYIKYLPSDKRIIWIDHHTYEYDVNSLIKHLNCKYIYDSKKSSALQTFEFLTEEFNLNNKLYELNVLTDIYDNWKTNDDKWKKAYALNDLFWYYGYEKFFVNYRNGLYFKKEDLEVIKHINSDRKQYILNTIKNHSIYNEKYKTIYILNTECKYINHYSLALHDIDNYIILKDYNDKIFSYSIKLYNTELKLTIQELFDKIKKMGINVIVCGGHSNVGSITIPYNENEIFLETLNNILEGEHD